ncbi:hypothetical protein FN846DRAFT_1004000 [Sphaerosporella brunnea]|uniref:Uncharacterized protein n=1 Tax=Sphaerosporella brunnea TaxID=1250544 RepID=A0A5J5EF47_9PEZI|nr:hypothetical protein FN846DRAFT_1004000 [Sphaerosporella brunnea]
MDSDYVYDDEIEEYQVAFQNAVNASLGLPAHGYGSQSPPPRTHHHRSRPHLEGVTLVTVPMPHSQTDDYPALAYPVVRAHGPPIYAYPHPPPPPVYAHPPPRTPVYAHSPPRTPLPLDILESYSGKKQYPTQPELELEAKGGGPGPGTCTRVGSTEDLPDLPGGLPGCTVCTAASLLP